MLQDPQISKNPIVCVKGVFKGGWGGGYNACNGKLNLSFITSISRVTHSPWALCSLHGCIFVSLPLVLVGGGKGVDTALLKRTVEGWWGALKD